MPSCDTVSIVTTPPSGTSSTVGVVRLGSQPQSTVSGVDARCCMVAPLRYRELGEGEQGVEGRTVSCQGDRERAAGGGSEVDRARARRGRARGQDRADRAGGA